MVRSDNQRRLQRSKQSERDLGHYLLEHNGPDPIFKRIASSTGRVGHITELQFDVISVDYTAENKKVRVPKMLLGWWDKIVSIATDYQKQPLLRIVPSNEGQHEEMHIITADRHAALLEIEKLWKAKT